jgi:hypothetical protein
VRKGCGVLAARLPGQELDATLINRFAVNTGIIPHGSPWPGIHSGWWDRHVVG